MIRTRLPGIQTARHCLFIYVCVYLFIHLFISFLSLFFVIFNFWLTPHPAPRSPQSAVRSPHPDPAFSEQPAESISFRV